MTARTTRGREWKQGPQVVVRSVAFVAFVSLIAGQGAVFAGAQPLAGSRLDPRLRDESLFLAYGHGPLHPAAYWGAKAAADARSVGGSAGEQQQPGESGPATGPSWEGEYQGHLTPPDPTGAIGATRYIELINIRFGIYDRIGSLIDDGPLETLTGHVQQCLTDPQVIWDTGQRRFYYVVLDYCYRTLAWGFSKTDSPSSNNDFCRYTADLAYGRQFPDYPMLGYTKDFLLIGLDVYSYTDFLGSDLVWINKTSAGRRCATQGSFAFGKFEKLRNADGSRAFNAVPAVQTDVSAQGFVVGTEDVSTGSNGTVLSIFRVRPDPAQRSVPRISPARSVSVPAYSLPPSAPQCNKTARLDTLDGRLEHAVSGIDPARGNRLAIWTAHAIASSDGARSEERWYEIDPLPVTSPSVLQSGVVSDPALYVYNGAISNDRRVGPDGRAFGGDMVMTFNTSSARGCPAIQVVSKVGDGQQSSFVLLKQSPGENEDFSCGNFYPCRWGDYSGASPDPAASLGDATGAVWISNEWNVDSPGGVNPDWRTWNAAVRP